MLFIFILLYLTARRGIHDINSQNNVHKSVFFYTIVIQARSSVYVNNFSIVMFMVIFYIYSFILL